MFTLKSTALICSALILLLCSLCNGQAAEAKSDKKAGKAKAKEKPFTPGGKYRAGDMSRPRPPVIDPGTPSTLEKPGRPPSDAIILFGGKGLSEWEMKDKKQTKVATPNWKLEKDYVECVPNSGFLFSKQKFGDCQLHVEWATPSEVSGSSQGRGNSGVFVPGFGEVQVLDSYQNDTYPDGQASALYGKYPPQVNASRKPGEWQMYDIIVELTKFDDKGQLTKPGHITVLHNGVAVHHAVEFTNSMEEASIGLQDHKNPVRYRNIWIRKLPGYDSTAPK